MTNDELREIVHSGRASYTLPEPDYSKANFAIYCGQLQDQERGVARFWPIIKVKYGKEESKTKGTEDGLGTTSTENSNREQS
jgi:hypothetical protein